MMKRWNFKFVCILTAILMNGVATVRSNSYEPRLKVCDQLPKSCYKSYKLFELPKACQFICSESGGLIFFECSIWDRLLNKYPDCDEIFCAPRGEQESTTNPFTSTTIEESTKYTDTTSTPYEETSKPDKSTKSEEPTTPDESTESEEPTTADEPTKSEESTTTEEPTTADESTESEESTTPDESSETEKIIIELLPIGT